MVGLIKAGRASVGRVERADRERLQRLAFGRCSQLEKPRAGKKKETERLGPEKN
jgi:hypothetical protein